MIFDLIYVKQSIMSTSQIFELRDLLVKRSFQEFQRIVNNWKNRPSLHDMESLCEKLYKEGHLRKDFMDYLTFFASINSKILHYQVQKDISLLQDLCYQCKMDEVKTLVNLFRQHGQNLKTYPLTRLVLSIMQSKHSLDRIINHVAQICEIRKKGAEFSSISNDQRDNYLVLYAIEKKSLTVAYQVLRNEVGWLKKQGQQLYAIPTKLNKKDKQVLVQFVRLYLQQTKFISFSKHSNYDNLIDRFPKDLQNDIADIFRQYQKNQKMQKSEKRQSRQNRKQYHQRKTQYKVRSTLAPGQHYHYQNSDDFIGSGYLQERIQVSVTTPQDEVHLKKQAEKVFEEAIVNNDKMFRYEKKIKKESQKEKRTGVIKSQQLRYYLQEQIKFQVSQIKDQHNRYKSKYLELIEQLQKKLCQPLNIDLEVFGSFRTQLCLPQSDIDIAITSQNKEFQENQITIEKLLQQIEYILITQMSDYIASIKFIKTASMPIIKVTCTEKYQGKKVDFTYQNTSHNGLLSVNLIKDYIKLYPHLESLIFILKKFIYTSNLSAPYHGGISSYGLILMIVAYIQNEYHCCSDPSKLLVADLLIGFLKFYGFKMNYVMKCIQISPIEQKKQNYSGFIHKYTDPNNQIDCTPKLVIIDPLNQNNNVGRPTHKIKQIQMAFEIAYISLHTFKQCLKKRRCQSFRRISKIQVDDYKYKNATRPCCILSRMFSCTQKFIKQ